MNDKFTAKGIKFRNEDHQIRFLFLLSRMRKHDCYHRAAAYLMALVPMRYDDVFDFEGDGIKHDGLFADWQTHSSMKATRLMFNLWNFTHEDLAAAAPADTAIYYTVDEIFGNREYAPFFYEAVRIRNEWV